MKILWFPVILFVGLMIYPFQMGSGCSCGIAKTATEGLHQSDVVFKGRVIAAVPKYQGGMYVWFEVEEVWKGDIDFITVLTSNETSCGTPFQVGYHCLVYAFETNSGGLGTDGCTRTRFVSNAAADLKELGLPKTFAPRRLWSLLELAGLAMFIVVLVHTYRHRKTRPSHAHSGK